MYRTGVAVALLVGLSLLAPVAAQDTSTTLTTSAPAEVSVGEPAMFEANLENATDVDFTWDFSDGSTASGWLVSNTFDEPGTYSVIVTAHDDGVRTTDTFNIVVRPEWQDTTDVEDTRLQP